MRVLVFGDSNSWGYSPDGVGRRLERQVRWPGVFAQATGVELIEEALPGRTTRYDDPLMRPPAAYNGLAHFETILLSHTPVDVVLIMLGTNDLKNRFEPSSTKIAENLAVLAAVAQGCPCGGENWQTEQMPRVGVIVPPPLGSLAFDKAWPRYAEWSQGADVGQSLKSAVQARFSGSDIPVFAAADHIESSAIDPIHLDPQSHQILGSAVASWFNANFAR
ncbi:MAG: arylesterase [Gammaproteobacteria bacterium]|nr:arylesterase [Gammaproteobacteria bacterium]